MKDFTRRRTWILPLLCWSSSVLAQSSSSTTTPPPGPAPTLSQVVSLWLPQLASSDVLASIIYYNASLTAFALACPSTPLPSTSPSSPTTPSTTTTSSPHACATTTLTQGPSTLIYTITLTDDESTPETRTTIISAPFAPAPSSTDSIQTSTITTGPTPTTKTFTHHPPRLLATINCVLTGSPTATTAICTSRSAIRGLGIQASTFGVPSEQIVFFGVTVTGTASPGATEQPSSTMTSGDDGGDGGPYDGTVPAPKTSSSGNAAAAQCTGMGGGWGVMAAAGLGVGWMRGW